LRIVGAVLEQAQVDLAVGHADLTDIDSISEREWCQGFRTTLLVHDGHEIKKHAAAAGIAFEDDDRVLKTVPVEVAQRVIVRCTHHDFSRGTRCGGFSILTVHEMGFPRARPL